MAIEYKVTSKKVLAGADKGKTKYYAMASNTGKTTLDDLTKDIERASTVNGADIRAVLYSLLEIVPTHLEAGNIVELGEIGTFRINISSKGEDTEKKVTVNSIKGGKIIFAAGKKFKQTLQNLKYKKK